MKQALAHIGIPTSSLTKSCTFYRALGFVEGSREEQPNGLPVVFMVSGGVQLELYKSVQTANRFGAIDHFALATDNIEQQWQFAQELGYPIIESEISLLQFGENGVRYFTICGPDHVKVEFTQKYI